MYANKTNLHIYVIRYKQSSIRADAFIVYYSTITYITNVAFIDLENVSDTVKRIELLKFWRDYTSHIINVIRNFYEIYQLSFVTD